MPELKPVELKVPAGGQRITIANGKLHVPEQPIVPFIEGDGTGRDIWRASVRVFDAAVAKAYGDKRRIHWMEVFAGEKAFKAFGTWLPDETVAACRDYLISIKGPLTTPIGGGIRSLNVALRQMHDLLFTPVSNSRRARMSAAGSSSYFARNFRSSSPRSASPTAPASASSRHRAKAASGCSARRSSMRSPTSAGA
jgi:hypothetical protein